MPSSGSSRSKLRAERAARTEFATERLARLTQPQVNTPIFSLGFLRSEDETANRVELGREPEWIILSVELSGSAACRDRRSRPRV